MDDEVTSSEYLRGFLGRVIAARELRYENQTEMAEALGMKQPTYSKYESRNLMPLRLIPRFCRITGVSLDWLIASKGPGPRWQPRTAEPTPRKKASKRPRKAA